ncbi:hypothetical protein [Sphaerisporangium aureirubrum]|uniref:Uncharacterized protein n=1 Tax=Sphaerisporangium aureirubrum TaxID=1544736 RepID=A0ABW1NR60_9ACTN
MRHLAMAIGMVNAMLGPDEPVRETVHDRPRPKPRRTPRDRRS